MQSKRAFTLIELLVVVLIIGILAAIALPQYQKVVWKSRATQLVTMVRSLATAQEAYHMASGQYATSFEELDIDFPSLEKRTSPKGAPSIQSTDAVRGDKWTEIIINRHGFIFSTGTFIAGPYRGGYIVFGHKDPANILQQKMYCGEEIGRISPAGSFCTKLFKTTKLVATQYGTRYYEIP